MCTIQNSMGESLKTAEASILLIPCCVIERGLETITGPLDNWMSLPSVWPELSMGFCSADIMLLSANQTTSERRES